MKYKLIVSDFDGTLAEDDKNISQRNISAIKSYVNRGGKFVVCTGRMSDSVVPLREIFGTQNQSICEIGSNGSEIRDAKGNLLSSHGINPAVARRIIEKAMQMDWHVHYYDLERGYACVKERDFIITNYEKVTGTVCKVVDLLGYIDEHPDVIIPKIMIVVAKEDMEKTVAEMEKDEYEGTIHTLSTANFLEYLPDSAGKGRALSWLANYYGIDLSETIAIGDNLNDMSMIETAGLGVAVASGREQLIAIADYVAPSNNESAVADVIEKFCGE